MEKQLSNKKKLSQVAFSLSSFSAKVGEDTTLLMMGDDVEISLTNSEVEKMSINEIVSLMRSHNKMIQSIRREERDFEEKEAMRIKFAHCKNKGGTLCHLK